MELEHFLENFSNTLSDTDKELIKPETVFRELGEWDSLTALLVVEMIDEKYDKTLTGEDLRGSVTILDIYKILKAKG
ncbi:phosphopantetheine-binding protein [Pedobacter sp. MC2016-14]|uniref:phosphopantetheine-binding protein n=1 Tax=Pedobacter sp. MC2016-14 TaxID=2897327 RepID=UPI001E421D2B|nr:phosphopantetheine-binding protein [Pedobacter sp. MC2016-14]MCD0486900.1 phosphopantetheine-binding protein [Pedobacter sp. MC2016-14]